MKDFKRYIFKICILIFLIFLSLDVLDAFGDVIVDNGAAGTSSTGWWDPSSGLNPYGSTSLYSSGGSTYTWHASLPQTGTYDVYAWWTTFSNRSMSAPFTVYYNGGSQTVSVNQQQNGGQWNYLGTFSFDAATGGTVKLTATAPYPTTYCADAIKFTYNPNGNITSAAFIDSITPNPGRFNGAVTFTGHGTPASTITDYLWRSSIDGVLSNTASFSTSTLSNGTHIIYFRVKDNSGTWSPEATTTFNVIEHIYACLGYGPDDPRSGLTATLQDIGASTQDGVLWVYTDQTNNKTYDIHIVTDVAGMKQALQTDGAHILFFGHSNYSLGPVFSTPAEAQAKVINDILYIDDDRILNISSPWMNVSIHGMRTSQAYPYWWPIFKDGTSGIMPYDFADPRGDPPYNYYLTYQVPGDPTYYKVETVRNSGMERFPDAGVPAWYSPSGAAPDPTTPDGAQYYITNPEPWYPSFGSVGNWVQSKAVPGYYEENYLYLSAGQGNNQATWYFTTPRAGNYRVYAWWPASQSGAWNAPYTINHASGGTLVQVDQRTNGSQWNELGIFPFNAGTYTVVLSDNASAGNVVADAVRMVSEDNPPAIIQSDFYARVRSGTAPLGVTFYGQNTGDVTAWSWDFGDGATSNTPDEITHVYANPGQYTVSLTVYGPAGSDTRTKNNYIVVGGIPPVVQAEFSADSRSGTAPCTVRFRDRSSGIVASRLWDFGDGQTGTEQRPTHVYSSVGHYPVTLTVTDAQGNISTETKENFVSVDVYDVTIDNVDYPKSHYGSKTILFRKELEVPKENLKYSRMFYLSCFSGSYFTDTFNRGIKFYTLDNSAVEGAIGLSAYLTAYLEGKSDYEIWEVLQGLQDVFDYYNFNKLPSEQ